MQSVFPALFIRYLTKVLLGHLDGQQFAIGVDFAVDFSLLVPIELGEQEFEGVKRSSSGQPYL